MDTRQQNETLTAPHKKEKQPIRLYFNIPPRLHSRLINYTRQKGFKDSTVLLVSIDEYLTKNNF